MINKTYKLLLGIFLLIVVDIIWVSSSELTKVCDILHLIVIIYCLLEFVICSRSIYIRKKIIVSYVNNIFFFQFLYQNENFDKPFFCTYFKTSMFTLYLLILGIIAPWKNSCDPNRNSYTVKKFI